MKRHLMAGIGYAVTGIGVYHVFFGEANLYSYLILCIGIAGVLFDVFYNKLTAEDRS